MCGFDVLTCARVAIHGFLNRNQSDFFCISSSHQIEANSIMSNERSSEVDYIQPSSLLWIWYPSDSLNLIQRKQEHRGESKDSSDPDFTRLGIPFASNQT
jgi:hypothetical protein